jgi:hypothetical protein
LGVALAGHATFEACALVGQKVESFVVGGAVRSHRLAS